MDVEPQTNIGIDELLTTHSHTNSRRTRHAPQVYNNPHYKHMSVG